MLVSCGREWCGDNTEKMAHGERGHSVVLGGVIFLLFVGFLSLGVVVIYF